MRADFRARQLGDNIKYERNLGYKIVGKPKQTELYITSLIPNRLYVKLIRFADSELVWFLQALIDFVFWYSELASMESTSSSTNYEKIPIFLFSEGGSHLYRLS